MPNPDALAIQLYTVRRQLADDLDGTLFALADIGFRQLEAFDLLAFADRLREPVRRLGLAVPSAHVDVLASDPAAVVGAAHDLGVATVVQPWTDPSRWRDVA